MLLKLNIVNTKHFVRYKTKMTFCEGSKTLAEYIDSIILDDGQKINVQEIVEVLVGVSFTDMTCFDKASFSFVNLDELKKLFQGGLLLNRFILYILIFKFCFLKNSKQRCWKMREAFTSACLKKFIVWKRNKANINLILLLSSADSTSKNRRKISREMNFEINFFYLTGEAKRRNQSKLSFFSLEIFCSKSDPWIQALNVINFIISMLSIFQTCL